MRAAGAANLAPRDILYVHSGLTPAEDEVGAANAARSSITPRRVALARSYPCLASSSRRRRSVAGTGRRGDCSRLGHGPARAPATFLRQRCRVRGHRGNERRPACTGGTIVRMRSGRRRCTGRAPQLVHGSAEGRDFVGRARIPVSACCLASKMKWSCGCGTRYSGRAIAAERGHLTRERSSLVRRTPRRTVRLDTTERRAAGDVYARVGSACRHRRRQAGDNPVSRRWVLRCRRPRARIPRRRRRGPAERSSTQFQETAERLSALRWRGSAVPHGDCRASIGSKAVVESAAAPQFGPGRWRLRQDTAANRGTRRRTIPPRHRGGAADRHCGAHRSACPRYARRSLQTV